MENLFFGVITIVLCIIGYIFSLKLFRQRRIKFSIVLLMGCGFLLRIYSASDFYLHPWDERYHALVAKNLIDHPLKPMLYSDPVLPYDYSDWVRNHVWVHKQPLPLWTMAISMHLFGINEIALRMPSIILTTLGIWITFFIGLHLFNPRVGFISAFLYSIHGLIIEMAAGRVATDHIDIFFLFFIELAVLFAIYFSQEKKIFYNLLCGLCIGAAILSKWLPALIVLPVWLLLVLDSKKFSAKEIILSSLLLVFTTMIVFLPWQLYIHHAFPAEAQWESGYNLRHITAVLDGRSGPFYYHFDKMRMLFGELIYIPFIWFLWKTFKNPKNYRRLLIAIWFLIPYFFFSIVSTKMQGYILFSAPALFIITALFCHYLIIYRNKFQFKRAVHLILILLIALPVRYSIERIKPFANRERNPQWVQDLRSLKNKIPDASKVVLFNTDHPIEAMFYTDCIAYSHIPDIDTIKKIIESGYTVKINDNEKIGTEIRNLEKVELVTLTKRL